MERRPLGETALHVSVVSLGTWAMSGALESWGQVDDNESIATIQHAIDCGINLIDTAPIYGLGHSEQIIGKAIRGRRDDVVLATKCGVLFPAAKDQPPSRCLAYRSVIDECDASLRRLQTDVIDLYQCHWPDVQTPIGDTMEALTTLLRQGKIRAVGLSNFGVEQIAEARSHGPVHCIQPPFSLLQPRASHDLIPYCRAHGVGVIAYSPLAKGLLTGKFAPETKHEGIRLRDPEFLGERYRRNLRTVDLLRPIAARYERTVGQLAINWVINQPGVTSAICGAKRPSQIMENAGGADWRLSEADQGELDRIMRGAELGH